MWTRCSPVGSFAALAVYFARSRHVRVRSAFGAQCSLWLALSQAGLPSEPGGALINSSYSVIVVSFCVLVLYESGCVLLGLRCCLCMGGCLSCLWLLATSGRGSYRIQGKSWDWIYKRDSIS